MHTRPICKELQKKAENELNEVSSRTQDDINHLREWIAQQPHLHARTDDQFLINFLRGSKFSLQRAKQKLSDFYSMRFLLPEFFSNRDPFSPEIQEALGYGAFLPLSEIKGSDRPRFILFRYGELTTKISFVTLAKMAIMIVDILMNEDDNFIIAGQYALIDFAGISLDYALTISPSVLKKSVILLETAYPSRPQAFDCMNVPSYCQAIFNMIKLFLTEKISKRMRLNAATEDIYKQIPPSILPKDYGGHGDSIADLTTFWKNKMESYGGWFKEDAQYYSDERKRPGKAKTSEEMFGIEGCFRRLNID